jgi:hypothetical protein
LICPFIVLMTDAVQEAGEKVEGVGVEAAGMGDQGSALQGLADRFRGQVRQIDFGSGVADFQVKMGVAAGAGRSSLLWVLPIFALSENR